MIKALVVASLTVIGFAVVAVIALIVLVALILPLAVIALMIWGGYQLTVWGIDTYRARRAV